MIVITQNIDISFKLPEIRFLLGFAAKSLVFSHAVLPTK
ncbi:oxidoreductase [Staphylococcus hominis]|nr:oxidoreductase [Staphylococcus hominis]